MASPARNTPGEFGSRASFGRGRGRGRYGSTSAIPWTPPTDDTPSSLVERSVDALGVKSPQELHEILALALESDEDLHVDTKIQQSMDAVGVKSMEEFEDLLALAVASDSDQEFIQPPKKKVKVVATKSVPSTANVSRADRSRAAFGRYGQPPESFTGSALADSTLIKNQRVFSLFQKDVADMLANPCYPHNKAHFSAFALEPTPQGFTRLFLERPKTFALGIVQWINALRSKKSVKAVEKQGDGGAAVWMLLKPTTVRQYVERLQCVLAREVGVMRFDDWDGWAAKYGLGTTNTRLLGEGASQQWSCISNALDLYAKQYGEQTSDPFFIRQSDAIDYNDILVALGEQKLGIDTPDRLQASVIVILGAYFGLRRSEIAGLEKLDLAYGAEEYDDGTSRQRIRLAALPCKNHKATMKDYNVKKNPRCVYEYPDNDLAFDAYDILEYYAGITYFGKYHNIFFSFTSENVAFAIIFFLHVSEGRFFVCRGRGHGTASRT